MIIGLDLSLKATGIAYWAPHERSAYTLRAPHDGIDRLRWIREQITDRLDHCAPELVVVEGVSYGSNQAFHAETCGLHWMVRDRIEGTWPLVVIPPATLKVFAAGHGHAKKDAMLAAVREFFRTPVGDHNQADAIALAFLGAAVSGQWKPTEPHQLRAIASVLNPPSATKKAPKARRPAVRRPKQMRLGA